MCVSQDDSTSTTGLEVPYNGEDVVVSLQPAQKRFKEDLSAFSFQKFAATYFITNVSHQFSKRHLKTSILDLSLQLQLSAQAMWITIGRFMGDIGESKYENDEDEDPVVKAKRLNIMHKLTSTLSKGKAKSREFQDFLKYGDTERKLISQTLRKKNKLPKELRQMIENSAELDEYQEWLNQRTSHIEKLHFITGNCSKKPKLINDILK